MVALGTAIFGAITLGIGAKRQRGDLLRAGYAALFTTSGLVTVAALSMVYALVAHDFSVGYVAQVGSRATPLFFTVISLWGALEGSILFWALVLMLYAAAVIYQNRSRDGTMVPYAGMTLLLIATFFLVLLVGPANPFGLVSPVPADGPGPNPLLQNHILMAVHPPLLYLGYVGMSVPFSFAVGAMLSGEVATDDWIRLTRRWTLTAWMFLSAAIIAGMWWSYEVLGWGGYWAWDPVENASFIPWLTATAFLHSVMVQERRGMLRVWNLNLIVGTFVLTILGTFLTRSGVLSSVHAFSQGPIGYYFLGFIAVVLVASLAMVAGTSDSLKSTGQLDAAVSRESVFLLNNLFLTAFSVTVLVGTLYPLVAEAIRGVKVSVGEPFFNRMTLPMCMALLFLMGVGPALPWRRASEGVVRRQLIPPSIGAIIAGALALLAGARSPYAVLAFTFAGFAAVANIREFTTGAAARRTAHGESWPVALGRLIAGNRRRFGGYVAHLGVILVAVGIAASTTFKVEHEATIKKGASTKVNGLTITLDDVWGREEPQRQVIGATVSVWRGTSKIGSLDPRMNFYPTSQQPVPTPSVQSRISGDIYMNLMAFQPDGSQATIRVILEPLVPWIWFGGLVVCFGALLAAFPPRRRAAAMAVEPVRSEGSGPAVGHVVGGTA